jgi:hypothetical protein
MDRARLGEIFQRRHIVVHNAGRASRLYLAKTSNAVGIEVGAALPVTSDYLQNSLDELNVVGVGLGTCAWATWFKEESVDAVRELQRKTFDLLVDERYDACARLCEIGLGLEGDGYTKQTLHVNRWIAQKQSSGVDAISSEVGAWDISALSPVFALARAALLDDFHSAFDLLPQLLERGDLTRDDLGEWPLFAEIRLHPRFSELSVDGDEVPAGVSQAASEDGAEMDEDSSSPGSAIDAE